MNKQKIYTAAGIALSFAIAAGGWMLTSALIDKKSDALLSASGSTWVNTPPVISTATPAAKEDEPVEQSDADDFKGITEREMVSVLRNWESAGREYPHEPMEGQITMERAIEIAEARLSYFQDIEIIPAPLHNTKVRTNAHLNQIMQTSRELDPIYSYWIVSFEGENIRAYFTIHAMTGQIWKTNIHIYTSVIRLMRMDELELILNDFMLEHGIAGDGASAVVNEVTHSTVTKSFAGGEGYAAIDTLYSFSGKEDVSYVVFELYFTTQDFLEINN